MLSSSKICGWQHQVEQQITYPSSIQNLCPDLSSSYCNNFYNDAHRKSSGGISEFKNIGDSSKGIIGGGGGGRPRAKWDRLDGKLGRVSFNSVANSRGSSKCQPRANNNTYKSVTTKKLQSHPEPQPLSSHSQKLLSQNPNQTGASNHKKIPINQIKLQRNRYFEQNSNTNTDSNAYNETSKGSHHFSNHHYDSQKYCIEDDGSVTNKLDGGRKFKSYKELDSRVFVEVADFRDRHSLCQNKPTHCDSDVKSKYESRWQQYYKSGKRQPLNVSSEYQHNFISSKKINNPLPYSDFIPKSNKNINSNNRYDSKTAKRNMYNQQNFNNKQNVSMSVKQSKIVSKNGQNFTGSSKTNNNKKQINKISFYKKIKKQIYYNMAQINFDDFQNRNKEHNNSYSNCGQRCQSITKMLQKIRINQENEKLPKLMTQHSEKQYSSLCQSDCFIVSEGYHRDSSTNHSNGNKIRPHKQKKQKLKIIQQGLQSSKQNFITQKQGQSNVRFKIKKSVSSHKNIVAQQRQEQTPIIYESQPFISSKKNLHSQNSINKCNFYEDQIRKIEQKISKKQKKNNKSQQTDKDKIKQIKNKKCAKVLQLICRTELEYNKPSQ